MTELERYKEAVRVVRERLERMAASEFVTNHKRWAYVRNTISMINVILNPPPVYEEVTVERWECQKCNSVYAVDGGHIPDKPISRGEGWGGCKCGYGKLTDDEAIKLTGTRRVQVAQKVERRVSVEVWIDGVGGITTSDPFCRHPETFSKHGTLTFTPDD